MDEHEENFKDIFRYTDVEYTPDGYTDVYRWDDFLVIAGDHVYSAMDTISSSRSSPNAVRALCRWLPRLGPPRGTRVARTVASGPDARYNRCGR